MIDVEINCSYTDALVCPYCGYDEEETCSDIYESVSEGEIECQKCNKNFKWEVEFSAEFFTKKTEKK